MVYDVFLYVVVRWQRCIPHQCVAVERCVLRCVIGLAIDYNRDYGLVAGTLYLNLTARECERCLHAVAVVLIVHYGSIVDVALALTPAPGLYDEEVFERHAAFIPFGEVGKVISELHGLAVQLSVGPTSQHWNLWGWVAVSVVSVTSILEVLELNDLFGRCGVDVGRYACRELYLAAA